MSKSDVPLSEIDTSPVSNTCRKHDFVTEEGRKVNALDTETRNGKPFLLSYATEKGTEVIESPDLSGLGKAELLKTLTKSCFRSSVNLWYNMKFDADVILSEILTDRQKTELCTQNQTSVCCKGVTYQITRIKGKIWKIKDKHGNIYPFFDISQFFYQSLDEASESWLGESKTEGIDTSRFDERSYIRDNYSKIKEYAEKDADLTRRLGKELIEHAEELDIPMSKPISTGYIGEAYLDTKGIKPDFGNSPYQKQFWESYYGGRFEVFERGNIGDVVAPDINSAYPAVMSELPNPASLVWEYRDNETEEADSFEPNSLQDADYGVVEVTVWNNSDKKIQPFGKKMNGRLTFPVMRNERITVLKEIFIFALRNGYVEDYELHNAWLGYETDETEFPFDFVKELYADRKQAEYVEGKPKKGKLIKIILNSLYGKTCQTTEKVELERIPEEGLELDEDKEPWKHPKTPFNFSGDIRENIRQDELLICEQVAGKRFNPFLASYITGMTRLKLHKTVEKTGLVEDTVMFATDCIMVRKEPYERSNFSDYMLSVDAESFDRETAKEALGKWDFDYSGDAFVVGSGVYEVSLENGGTYQKTRGFRQADLDGSLTDLAEEHDKGIPISNVRPLTMNEVLSKTDNAQAGVFTEVQKELQPDFDSKRKWENPSTTFSNLLSETETSEPLYAD
jgi:hypothetical protein